jgi:hypothetical protein
MEGQIGFRCVRTAPEVEKHPLHGETLEPDGNGDLHSRFTLAVNPLPDLRGPDINVFYLSGRFRNDGDEALRVELSSPLPDACFPEGAASRTFTAPPKADTRFRILIALTLKAGRAARKGQVLPVSVKVPGGDVLAEQRILLPLADPLAVTPPIIGTVDGGKVTLSLANTTDRPHAVTIEMPPSPGIEIQETKRRVEVASGGKVEVAFPIRSHVFEADRFYRLPYRVAVADGSPQQGDAVAELHVQSRWWIGRHKLEPLLEAADGPLSKSGVGSDALDVLLEESVLADDGVWAVPTGLFEAAKPPGDWSTVTHGAGLWVGHLIPRPIVGTVLQAATRVTSPGEREAVIRVGRENASYVWLDGELLQDRRRGVTRMREPAEFLRKNKPGHFIGRILFNGEVVYDSRPRAKEHSKPVRIRKGVNTMLVQCLVHDEKPQDPGDFFFLFYDAGNGTRLSELVLDISKR